MRRSKSFILLLASSLAALPLPRAAAQEPAPAPDDITVEDEAEAAPEAEEIPDLASDDASRPPSPGKGAVWGVVSESELGEALIEASVRVLGTKFEVVTDVDGRFRLELPPGTYSLRVSYELHKSMRIDGVVVEEGKVLRVDAKLEPDQGAVDVIEIVEETDESSLEGLILARQRATIVGDGVGRTEIAKTPDRNAAQAAQRVVGATVVGGRFVFVRGLGERYSNALLNGVPLPSPEPDRAAVPLDLFPTGVLSSLTIAKTFTPDVPGDFAGGSVRVETREIPASPVFQVTLSGGLNTESTFRERLSYRGGSLDWLGIDDGTRALPDGFPRYKQAERITRPDGTRVDEAELVASGRKLNSYMSTTQSGTPPDHGLTIVAGKSWSLGGDQKLGAVASLNYSRSYVVRRDEIRREYLGDQNDPRGFSEIRDYRVTTGSENVSWGGFGNLTYRLSPNHQLSLLGLRTTIAENFAQEYSGRHLYRNLNIFATKLALITRALNMGQLRGEHVFPSLNGSRLDWYASLSRATRDQPKTRDVVWGDGLSLPEVDYVYTEGNDAGRHFYSEQGETQYGAGLDLTTPIIQGKRAAAVKLGGSASVRDRDFSARSLRYRREASLRDPLLHCDGDFSACSDRLFRDANIGPVLLLDEATSEKDAYRASLDVFAGYVMADVKPWEDVRLVVGSRLERTHQVIDPYDQFGLAEPPEGAEIDRVDPLPALSASWSFVPKANLRAAVTRTLARPQLRELAPFTFSDFFGGRQVAGNPALELTRITNVDLRVEYFPSLKEVLAFSVFFKQFEDPIEPILFGAGERGVTTFQNAEGATLIGLELEARKSLEFLARPLRWFGLVGNLTLAQSKIRLAENSSLIVTNESRPLVQQAPYVLNLALDYSNDETGTSGRLLYNVTGPRISEVGAEGLPDVYVQERGVLDLTLQQKLLDALSLRLAIRNILNTPVQSTQGCSNDGVFGSTWRLSCAAKDDAVVRRYTEGTSFALSASYDF